MLLFTLVLLSQILSVDAERLEGVDGQEHIANICLLVLINSFNKVKKTTTGCEKERTYLIVWKRECIHKLNLDETASSNSAERNFHTPLWNKDVHFG